MQEFRKIRGEQITSVECMLMISMVWTQGTMMTTTYTRSPTGFREATQP